ncbi:MAG TPA: IPT/TIG domain-containing protein [Thermoanaerobaculia bacterium]
MRRAMWFAIALAIVPTVSAFATTVNVSVGPGLSFSPPNVTVVPGDTVVWTFLSFHSSTSDVQSGPEVWDSGVMLSGTFSHTFTTPGTYPYYCSLHSFPGGTFMNGSVQVQAPAAVPTLTSVSPSSGSSSGGTAVTLTGTNFDSTCTVDFGGAAATAVSATNATTINATTPAHAAGAVTVGVTCGGSTATLTNGFTFNNAPAITTVTPGGALPGSTITITGSGFQSGATVTFRGTASPTVTFVNATTLQAVVPNIANGAATIVVTNPDTLSGSFSGFTVTSIAIPMLSTEFLLLLGLALAIVAAIRSR